MAELTTLPNIGIELAVRLKKVGIETSGDLEQIGAEDAFIRLRTTDPTVCINQLFALEGAIQGMRWHGIDALRKLELKDFYSHLRRN